MTIVATYHVGRRLVAFFALLSVMLTLSWPAAAQPAAKSYAVLIVGDEGDAEMLRVEKVLINEMAKLIRSEANAEQLPIFSYHFNKERERAYCENKLNVLAEDLLFVGVVTLENKVPQKVVYRIDRIVNAPRAARDVLEMAEELAEIAPSERPESPSSPPTTQPSTTTPAATMPATQTSSGTSNEEGFRIQLGSFTLKNYAEDRKAEAEKAGFQVSIVETTGPDGDVVYKVLSSTYKVKAEAEASLAKFKAAGFEQSFLVRLPSK